MKITIKEYNFTYKVDLKDDTTCDEFMDCLIELAGKIYHTKSVEDCLKDMYDKSYRQVMCVRY